MPHVRYRWALATLPIAAVLLTTAAAIGIGGYGVHAQQSQTSLGIDADTAGNTATKLGTINDCVEIGQDSSHDVDIFVQDVTKLLAWDAVLTFDPAVLKIREVDAGLFMAANEGSDVQDITHELSDGRYQVGSFDAAEPPAPDSGSGVLLRVTVEGIGPGVSEIILALSDVDGDGSPDEGPLLRDVDAAVIGDDDGDAFFDGPISQARLAVDASCSDAPGAIAQGESSPEAEDESDGLDALTIVAVVVGLIASLAVGGTAAWIAIRRRLRTRA